MASSPSPVTASSPPSESESTSPPPAAENSSPPPPEDSSPPPPQDSSPPPPQDASPPPLSPPPLSSPPPSEQSPPPHEESSPPPSPTPENSSPPPAPDQSGSTSPPQPSSSQPPPPSPSNNNGSPSTFSPPPHPSVSSQTPPPPSGKLTPSPPPARKPPPSSSHDGSSDSPSNSDSSDNNVAIIAGIAVAGVLILAVIIIAVMCSRKKKRKPYYMDPGRGPPPGGDYYHGSANPWQSPPTDHVVKLPPPPGLMGTPVGGGGGWGPPPPPPPPMGNTSSDFSSGFFGPHHMPLPPPSPNMGNVGLGFSKSQFTFEELAAATGGFSQAKLLGQGGFGYVHKGVLPNGQEVAVKSLKSGSGQGEREFQAEVEIISRVHHRHLVSLVGYCIADSQRMLVYEFVPNSTLEFHLHGKGRPVMDWSSRTRIAMGSAKGLAYLHEDCHPRIIHRDIKAANILIDDNYEAMVADFGLAKLSSDNYTHVSTRVMGTFGYLAPEYASSGKLTEKSDVFSFGVMLLELITGKRPVDPTNKYEDSLVDWARPLLAKAIEDGDYTELADPRMEGNYSRDEMARLVTCAAASIRHSARRRPKMSQIVRALEGDASLDDLNEGGVKPGNSSMYSSNQGHDATYDTGAYNADMMKFRKMVMNSQEFNSSEYGATSEYGLNPSSSSSELGNSGPQSRQKL